MMAGGGTFFSSESDEYYLPSSRQRRHPHDMGDTDPRVQELTANLQVRWLSSVMRAICMNSVTDENKGMRSKGMSAFCKDHNVEKDSARITSQLINSHILTSYSPDEGARSSQTIKNLYT